jgi:predicted GIY-YIG superfamily endonuclease
MKLPRTVYALRHEATGKVYIGSTADPRQRLLKHLNRLKNGTHNSKQLQADYDQHADKSLTLEVLDEIRDFGERDKEYRWMEIYNTFDPVHGYNYADPKLPASPSHRRSHTA